VTQKQQRSSAVPAQVLQFVWTVNIRDEEIGAHRSIPLLAGPHARREYVARTLASFRSIRKLNPNRRYLFG